MRDRIDALGGQELPSHLGVWLATEAQKSKELQEQEKREHIRRNRSRMLVASEGSG